MGYTARGATTLVSRRPRRVERDMSMDQELSDEKIAELQDAFCVFDKEGSGFVATKELGTILRSQKMKCTDTELQDLTKEIDPQGNDTFDFVALLELVESHPELMD